MELKQNVTIIANLSPFPAIKGRKPVMMLLSALSLALW